MHAGSRMHRMLAEMPCKTDRLVFLDDKVQHHLSAVHLPDLGAFVGCSRAHQVGLRGSISDPLSTFVMQTLFGICLMHVW